MLHALLRKARADVLGSPLQTTLVFLVVAAASATLTMALVSKQSADDAYINRLAETNGAHAWFFAPSWISDPSYLTPIGGMDGVTAAVGPFPVVWGPFPLVRGDEGVDVQLFGMPPELPEVGRPKVTDGRWLALGGTEEIVIDHGLARVHNIKVGDRVEVLKGGGSETFEVVGLAVTAARPSYPVSASSAFENNSFAFVLPETLTRFQPDTDSWSRRFGVRLEEPDDVEHFVRQARGMYPEGEKPGWVTWTMVRADVTEGISLLTAFIGVFGVFAIGAAAFVVANVIGGHVLAQVRDIGLLKAVGFTPGQVAALLLFEHVGLGLPAAVLGVGIGVLVAPAILHTATPALGVAPPLTIDPGILAAIAIGVPLVIAVITMLPAWRGGRIPTVQAITTGLSRAHSRPSRPARLATWLRMPPVVALGFKDAFNRPVRAALTVGALAAALIIATLALGTEATLRAFIDDPRLTGGEAYELWVWRGLGPDVMGHAEVSSLLESRPEVKAYYSQRWLRSNIGGTDAFLGAADGDYAELAPYIREGRIFARPGEVMVSRKMSEGLGLEIGDTLTYVIDGKATARFTDGADMHMDGKALQLEVVGVYIEGDNPEYNARTSLDTLRRQVDPNAEPHTYHVKLIGGADPEAVKLDLFQDTGGRLRVEFVEESEEARETAGVVRPPIYGVTAALLGIGAANLLITLLFAVRERYRELGVLKALGLTPWQVLKSVVVTASMLGVIAVAIGAPLGLVLTRISLSYVGEEVGLGSAFGTMPGPFWMAVLVLMALGVAVLGAALPAVRAAGLKVVEALRYE